jgi:hypothetical protein
MTTTKSLQEWISDVKNQPSENRSAEKKHYEEIINSVLKIETGDNMADEIDLNYDFQFLTPSERMAMIRPRLEESERLYYQEVLNSQTQLNYDLSQLSQIQTRINWLKNEYKKLTAEDDAANSAANNK